MSNSPPEMSLRVAYLKPVADGSCISLKNTQNINTVIVNERLSRLAKFQVHGNFGPLISPLLE